MKKTSSNLTVAALAVLAVAKAQAEIIELTAAARQIGSSAYEVSASSETSPYIASHAFDNDWTKSSNNAWHSDPAGGLDQSLTYHLTDNFHPSSYIRVYSYSIYYYNNWCGAGTAQYPRKLPKSWTFEGSNDGTTWTVLDSHTNWNEWERNAWNTFPATGSAQTFRYFRLHATDVCNTDANNQYYVIPELRIYGELFDSAAAAMVKRAWTGAAGSDDWSDGGNWTEGPSGATAPAAGDVVIVPAGATSVLPMTTPNYDTVEIHGTLVMTNWTTCLNAATVTIASGGNLTCGAAVTNKADMSRVWVNCTDLTVAAGGKIDVSNKGYLGLPKLASASSSKYGFGPGRSTRTYMEAPSHGGYGGFIWNGSYTPSRTAFPYDDPAAPTEPGSSGLATGYGYGGSGGGVVLVTASGRVTVDGTIAANGQNCHSYGGTAQTHAQPGAGGSVWVTCRTFAGGGSVTANGGGGDKPGWACSVPAGGGCIAIHYDTTAQTADAVAGMTISAAAGLYSFSGYSTTCVTADKKGAEADLGTLHFSDDKIVRALLGNGLTGRIKNMRSYAHDGDLNFTSGHVRFDEEGAELSVSGNLVINGASARLDMGGGDVTNSAICYLDVQPGTNMVQLLVGGNLTVGGGARLDVRSAQTNCVSSLFGAYVRVGGEMTIETNCIVYAWGNSRTRCGPHFEVGSLHVATGGVFSAYRRGGPSGLQGKASDYKSGTGLSNVGGGHGGRGGLNKPTWSDGGGFTYDNLLRPCMPGAGGGSYNNYVMGGWGGGSVHVSATNGIIRIDGEINADGESGADKGSKYGGGGAGGTIFLEGRQIFCGDTAKLSAIGGDTEPVSTVNTGSGGGGRIALWCGDPWSADLRASRIVTNDVPFVGSEYAEYFSFSGSYSVAPGEVFGDYAKDDDYGAAGTVRFCFVRPMPGFCFVVR